MRHCVFVIGIFAIVSLANSAQAGKIPACSKPWELYAIKKGGTFRPMLRIEARSRAENTAGSEAQTLAIDLTMSRDDKPVYIGGDAVVHLPVFRAKPAASSVSVYFTALDGSTCEITADQLGRAEFERAFDYSGAVLSLRQGDTLKADVRSILNYTSKSKDVPWRPEAAPYGGGSCEQANLHTHGFLVSPYKHDGKLGDYIYDAAARHGAKSADVCQKVMGELHSHGEVAEVLHHEIAIPGHQTDDQGDALLSGHHPSGLFWYHPHIHGYSAEQVSGGTTGLITVGSISDYVRPGTIPLRQHVRFMMLKDMQLSDTGRKVAGREIWDFNATSDPALCNFASDGLYGFFQDAECYGKTDKKQKWIFTINGVQKPRIEQDVKPFEAEIWRIANASASLSYHLSLIPVKELNNPNGQYNRVPFDILSKDGAGFRETSKGENSTRENQVLLMPGSRVEIMLKSLPAEELALVSEGVKTGGDAWPRVVLATVKGTTPRGNVQSFMVERNRYRPITLEGPRLNALPEPAFFLRSVISRFRKPTACGRIDGWERVIFFVKNPAIPEGSPDLFGIVMGLRRAGVRDPGKMTFFEWNKPSAAPNPGQPIDLRTMLGSTSRIDFTQMQKAAFSTGLKAAAYVPGFGNYPSFGNVCVPHGEHYAERWVIENWTNEIHNFHLHQTRFVVDQSKLRKPSLFARADPRPEYFQFPCSQSAYAKGDAACDQDAVADKPDAEKLDCAHNTEKPECKTTGYGDELIRDFFTSHRTLGFENALIGASLHDSVPIPRGTGDCDGKIYSESEGGGTGKCIPGRVTLIVPLNRQEQIGTYVYHCHILEHEDRGMMATIQVYDPKQKETEILPAGEHSQHN